MNAVLQFLNAAPGFPALLHNLVANTDSSVHPATESCMNTARVVEELDQVVNSMKVRFK
jgi:hypothetical protein